MRLIFTQCAAAAVIVIGAATSSAQPSIRVCEHRNLGGKCVTLQHGVNDLREWGISNKISSYRVDRGEWRLCTGFDFTGYCQNVKGYMGDLIATPLQDSVNSLRPVREGGGSGGRDDRTAIAVYTRPNFSGRSWVFSDDVRDLSQVGLNSQISSVRIYGGRWQLCERVNFGNCQSVTRDVPDLRAAGIDNRVSSIREEGDWGRGRSGGSSGGPPGGRGGGGSGWMITLFDDRGFSGLSFSARGEIRNLADVGFNDLASSIIVTGGRWQICTDRDFRGQCETITANVGRLGSNMDNQVSSVRPLY